MIDDIKEFEERMFIQCDACYPVVLMIDMMLNVKGYDTCIERSTEIYRNVRHVKVLPW